MPTLRRRNRPATGAFFFSTAALSLALFVTGSGCSSLPKVGKNKTAAPAGPTLVAPKHLEVGRILSHDPAEATAVVEFVPQFRSAAPLVGTRLIARKPDTLAPTARLVAAPYQNNRTLGAYVSSGIPGIDDEVVIDPESALPENKPADAAPAKPKGKPMVVIPATPEAPKPRGGGRR